MSELRVDDSMATGIFDLELEDGVTIKYDGRRVPTIGEDVDVGHTEIDLDDVSKIININQVFKQVVKMLCFEIAKYFLNSKPSKLPK